MRKPEGRKLAEVEYNTQFVTSDANKDKLLNLEEYLDFMEKQDAAKKGRNEPVVQRTKEEHEAMFNAIN